MHRERIPLGQNIGHGHVAYALPDGKATLNGSSGTFSGTDAISGAAVFGDFACTN